VSAAWFNWKKMTGVLCDKKMKIKLKSKINRTMIRPAMIYEAETWTMKKVYEKRLDVAEMRMLRWNWGVTRLDRIWNEVIRSKMKATEVSKKIQERRLQWFGHVERRDELYVGKKIDRIVVMGKRGRGRPKKKWSNCVNEDLKEKNLTGREVHNRSIWKQLSRNTDSA